jgi:hypothetical protein
MDSLKKKLAETKTELDAKEAKVSELEKAQARYRRYDIPCGPKSRWTNFFLLLKS